MKVHWCSASCACIYIGYYCCWYAYMDRPFGGRPPTRYRKVLWTCDKSEPARSAILRPTLTQFRHFAALMSNHKVSLAYELLLMRWVIKLSTPAITPAFLYSFIFHRCYFFYRIAFPLPHFQSPLQSTDPGYIKRDLFSHAKFCTKGVQEPSKLKIWSNLPLSSKERVSDIHTIHRPTDQR